MRHSDTWIWDRYWAADRIAACLNDAAPNYSGEVRAVWEAVFAELPSGTRLLDVGTGNGAVAMIANEVSRAAGKSFEIHGVDSADIDPPRYVSQNTDSLSGIRFHPRTPAEALPFDDASFDAVTAHFALEYTDLERSVGELARVLRAAGRGEFVLHAESSFVVEATRRELAQIELIETTRLLDHVEALLAAVHATGQAGRDDAAKSGYAEAKQAFNDAARHVIAEGYALGKADLVDVVLQILAEIYQRRAERPLQPGLADIAELRLELEAHQGRLRAQRDVALSPDGLAGLLERLRAAGFSASPGEAWDSSRERLLGWRISASRDGPAA